MDYQQLEYMFISVTIVMIILLCIVITMINTIHDLRSRTECKLESKVIEEPTLSDKVSESIITNERLYEAYNLFRSHRQNARPVDFVIWVSNMLEKPTEPPTLTDE